MWGDSHQSLLFRIKSPTYILQFQQFLAPQNYALDYFKNDADLTEFLQNREVRNIFQPTSLGSLKHRIICQLINLIRVKVYITQKECFFYKLMKEIGKMYFHTFHRVLSKSCPSYQKVNSFL